MQRAVRYFFVLLAAVLVAGCGGSGSTAPAVFRTLAGYVFVTGNAGSGSPDVIVSPNSTPPNGYFAPTAGTMTLSVTDGAITRAPDQEIFDMTVGNEIICTVSQNSAPFNATLSGSGLQYNGTAKAFSTTAIALNSGPNGSVLAISIGAPSYTPGPPAQIRLLVRNRNGNPGTSALPFQDPGTATGGNLISGNRYDTAAVAYDAEGTIINSATITISSSDTSRATINGSNQIVPAEGTGVASGSVDIRAAVTTPSALQEQFTANFNYGTATNMAVSITDDNLTWQQFNAGAGVVESTPVSATLTNQYSAPIPNATVNWSIPGETTGANWNAPVPGAAFSGASSVTNNAGVAAITASTPTPTDGPLPAPMKFPKGANNLTADSGSATGFDVLTIERPLGSIQISGPSRLDINTPTTPTTGSRAFKIDGALDVDNDTITVPGGPQTWSLTNGQFSALVGNTGDQQVGTTSASTINPSNGQVTPGAAAGAIGVSVTIGTTTSNTVTTQVFGNPSKLIFSPNTLPTLIPTASGEYFFPAPGSQQQFGFTLQDSAGHNFLGAEFAGYSSTATIQSSTGGSITPGGFQQNSFTITGGNTDGLFTIGITGTWVGADGGSGSINLTRNTGHNAAP